MYRTQLVTTKGEIIRTFFSTSRPATQSTSTMGSVEITYTDNETSFTIIGNFNVIVEKLTEDYNSMDKETLKKRFFDLSEQP